MHHERSLTDSARACTFSRVSGPDIRLLRAALLSWYDRAKRRLPWREHAHDPYAVWVSEVMLQQTRVDTVLPYYQRFLSRFPSLEALALASEDEVLAAWSGLGYYRRARMLHQGVREVVARYGGAVPRDPEARLSLPGVGRYTAGALGSVCFGLEEPIVDGNVARILTRLFGITSALPDRVTQVRLWDLAEQLVVGERPGDFNQAMMELGALVCTVKSPGCDACPARDLCVARQQGIAHELPRIPRKAPPRPTSLVAVVATRGAEVALVRGDDSLFGGLYGLPMAPLESSEAHAPLHAAANGALMVAGISARVSSEPVGEVQHILSHRRLRVIVFTATHARITGSDGPARLLPLGADRQLDGAEVGIAKLTHKVLAVAAGPPEPQAAAPRQSRRAHTK
ncbi:MAG: A/G-specific adenine glycosylase [Sandaracinaceae bacterium]|jgi:A/G-specific adenine glycosylase|nr:A/G-specific adenine glycosylase [Sandaracinaceae bacterium]MBK7156639.1 A/G-specific adenine glycosylase [Sandaracinaceae bacterium]